MDFETISAFCRIYYDMFRIPFYIYEGETRLASFEPMETGWDLVARYLFTLSKPEEPINYLMTKDQVSYGRVAITSTPYCIVIGPTRIGRITDTIHKSILMRNRVDSTEENLQLLKTYLDIASSVSIDQFLRILCMLHASVNRQFVNWEELTPNTSTTNIEIETNLRMIHAVQEHSYSDLPRRNGHNLEAELMFYISNGMTEALSNMNTVNYEMPTLANNSIRHYQNTLIILNTLSQRAAIMGGVDPEICYQLGEIYIHKIESLHSIGDISNLGPKLMMDYCTRVAQFKHPKTNHAKINKAMHYVRENCHKRLSVEEIADAVHLSKEYLSSKFKEVTGVSLPDYINQQKVSEAKQYLLFTDMSLAEIAESLSFSSQSYFQSVFKKHTGHTPAKYRAQDKAFVLKV